MSQVGTEIVRAGKSPGGNMSERKCPGGVSYTPSVRFFEKRWRTTLRDSTISVALQSVQRAVFSIQLDQIATRSNQTGSVLSAFNCCLRQTLNWANSQSPVHSARHFLSRFLVYTAWLKKLRPLFTAYIDTLIKCLNQLPWLYLFIYLFTYVWTLPKVI